MSRHPATPTSSAETSEAPQLQCIDKVLAVPVENFLLAVLAAGRGFFGG